MGDDRDGEKFVLVRWHSMYSPRKAIYFEADTFYFIFVLPPLPTRRFVFFLFFLFDFVFFFDRETQAVLEDDLGLSPHVLGRGIFQGQHHLNGLLESTDAQLKEDLALLVYALILSSVACVLSCCRLLWLVALVCIRSRAQTCVLEHRWDCFKVRNVTIDKERLCRLPSKGLTR